MYFTNSSSRNVLSRKEKLKQANNRTIQKIEQHDNNIQSKQVNLPHLNSHIILHSINI